MNKYLLFLILLAAFSCNQQASNQETQETEELGEANLEEEKTTEQSQSTFDINTIPISDKELMQIPFFELPDGYQFQSPKNMVDFDRFAVFVDNNNFLFKEGKLFQSRVHTIGDKKFSLLEITRNIENIIESVNGKKISEAKVSLDAVGKIGEEVSNMFMYNGYSNLGHGKTFTYLIRNKDKETWVQITEGDDNASVNMGIVQTIPLKITASLKTSQEIADELTQSGKSILYINFETNKATLTHEGSDVVNQITKALTDNASLKVSIEGHTDNSGSVEHNQKLSEERANTVKAKLIAQGIDKDRLQTVGYGQSKPLAENDTEENKAKNRRVELVKIN